MNDPFGSFGTFALTFLANGLWEALLLAGAAAFVLRLSPAANATTRHAVLVTALVAAIALPVLTTALAFAPHPEASQATRVATVPPLKTVRATVVTTRVTSTRSNASASSSSLQIGPRVARPQLTLPRLAILALVGLWLAGALFFLMRLAISLVHLERLKRDALPLPIAFREPLERWTAVGRGRRDVRLCRSAETTVPIAVGLFDAMILLPDRLLEDLAPEDLDRIVLHELAHLRRGDDWSNGFERLAEAVLFFNPGVRWLVRQLDLEREVACDDWVLERRTDALPYAQCLVKLVEEISWPYRPLATAPGAFVTRRSISVRIERLLAARRDVRIRFSPAPLVAAGTVTLATCLLGAYVSPSIAQVCTSTSPTRQPSRTVVSQPSHAAPPARHAAHPAPLSVHPTALAVHPAALTVNPATLAVHPAAPAVALSSAPVAHVRTHAEGRPAVPVAVPAFAHASSHATVASSAASSALQVAFDPSSPSPKARDYISELESAGYAHLSVDDLIRLKSVGVTGDYVRAMQAAGSGHPSVETLVQLRAVGVTPDYVRDMHARFGALPLDELAGMRAGGLTSQYVADLQAAGVHDLSAESAKSMRAVGVDAAYVRALAAAGYAHLSAQQLTQLRAVGIDEPFIKSVAAHGFHNIGIDELVRLKTSGVL